MVINKSRKFRIMGGGECVIEMKPTSLIIIMYAVYLNKRGRSAHVYCLHCIPTAYKGQDLCINKRMLCSHIHAVSYTIYTYVCMYRLPISRVDLVCKGVLFGGGKNPHPLLPNQ